MLKRFLYSYFLLCVIPFVLLGVLVANISGESIKAELFNAAEISMDESYRSIKSLVKNARDTALAVAGSQALQVNLQNIHDGIDAAENLEQAKEWIGTCPLYSDTNTKLCLFLETECPEIKDVDTAMLRTVDTGFDEGWYRAAVSEPSRFHWSLYTSEGSTVLRQSKCIYSIRDWKTLLGVVTVDVSLEQMRSIAMAANTTGNRLYLVDEKGTIAYPYYNYDRIPEEVLTSRTDQVFETENNVMLVRCVEPTGWNLIKIISLTRINQKTDQIKATILTLAVVFAVISLLAAVYFEWSISRPMKRLAGKMKSFRAGDLTAIEGGPKKGEIGALYESFNYMAERISTQIDETYVAQIREKDAELRALQAQINPHFLYNTLDSINWLALRYKAYDISKMVLALSDMLRLSLNKGRNTLLVRDELRQVDSYIALQKVRYSDSFSVRYEVEPGTENRRIIKMLLQPIVENAILHGFEEMESGGIINIVVRDTPEGTYFEVSNNGILIDLEQMEQKLAGKDDEESKRRGYGIRNVNQRIKAFYGEKYGIRYSIRGDCTVASFVIPDKEGVER